MNKTLSHDPTPLIHLCRKEAANDAADMLVDERVSKIKSKDFDNTPEARALSTNFASFEAILHELGINKPAIQKYCRIAIAEAKGRTGTFQCSDLTVGARFFYGDSWPDLSKKEIERCSKQGVRLNAQLAKVCPGLVLRKAKRGDTPTELQVPLINVVLRVSELLGRLDNAFYVLCDLFE